MKRLMFVCTGNTCRSPMAESIMKQLIKEKGIKNLRVSSCGLAANPGNPMTKEAAQALKQLGIKPHAHKAKQCTPELLQNRNLILTMTAGHKAALSGIKNVFTIGEFTSTKDIADPFSMPQEIYDLTARQLLNACNIILDTIT